MCLEREELEAHVARLEREVERLNKEADWLANQIRDCPDEVNQEEYWDICKKEDCAGWREDKGACWRRAAREAVEKSNA